MALGTALLALASQIAPANLTFDLRASAVDPDVGVLSSDGKAVTLSGGIGTVTLQLWAQLTNTAPTSSVFGVQSIFGSIVSVSGAQPLLSGSLTPSIAAPPFDIQSTPGVVGELTSPADGVLDLESDAPIPNTSFIKLGKNLTSGGTQVGTIFFASNLAPAGATFNVITNGYEFLMGSTTLSIDSYINLQGSLSLNWRIPVLTTPANRGRLRDGPMVTVR